MATKIIQPILHAGFLHEGLDSSKPLSLFHIGSSSDVALALCKGLVSSKVEGKVGWNVTDIVDSVLGTVGYLVPFSLSRSAFKLCFASTQFEIDISNKGFAYSISPNGFVRLLYGAKWVALMQAKLVPPLYAQVRVVSQS